MDYSRVHFWSQQEEWILCNCIIIHVTKELCTGKLVLRHRTTNGGPLVIAKLRITFLLWHLTVLFSVSEPCMDVICNL
jgi:hypothetical protein